MKQNQASIDAYAIILVFLLFIFFPIATSAQQNNAIYWAHYDFPPAFIISGPYAESGLLDGQVKLLQEKMKGYEHIRLDANVARITFEMKEGKPICTALLKNPEREKFMHYSIPSILVPTHSLHILKSAIPQFEEKIGKPLPQKISLEVLLRDHSDLTMGAVHKRSYGSDRDKLITQYQEQILFRVGGDDASGLFNMFRVGRVDYIIEYPWLLTFQFQKQGVPQNVYSIELESPEKYLISYIACTKNTWGELIIRQVNQILLAERPTESYRALVEHWLNPSSIPAYRKNYEEFLNQKK